MQKINCIFDDGESRRLDVYIADKAEITRSYAATLIADGCVLVNQKSASKNTKLKSGDTIDITLPDAKEYTVESENIPIDIVYEDKHLLVVNKPKDMVVHPAAGNYSGTLVNAILYHCGDSLSGINGVMRPGILHRIDKNTSGLLLVAKNDNAHLFLAEQIKEHSLTREYETVVYGNLKNDSGTVDAPIARHPVKRKQMAIVDGGRNAVTHYTVLERFGNFTHVKLRLQTGRTHQIRVQFANIGHPLAGDTKYGAKGREFRQALYSTRLEFDFPKGSILEYLNGVKVSIKPPLWEE